MVAIEFITVTDRTRGDGSPLGRGTSYAFFVGEKVNPDNGLLRAHMDAQQPNSLAKTAQVGSCLLYTSDAADE